MIVCGTLAVVGSAGGCYQKSTYPAIPAAAGHNDNPNTPSGEQAIVAALQYVGSRWSPGEREFDARESPQGKPMVPYAMVVNLPAGTRKLFYERIPAKVGPNVRPATGETVRSGEPLFHVSRVWLRFDRGTIDVLRPMPEMGPSPTGGPVYQKITLRLEGGMQPWRVVHARAWSPGADMPPELNFVPETDNPNEYVLARQRAQARLQAQAGPPTDLAQSVQSAAATDDFK